MESELRVGVIVRAHGLKGEVKVYPTTDTPQRFDELKKLRIKAPSGVETVAEAKIESVKYFKGLVILGLSCIHDISEAERYRGFELYIPREDGSVLAEGEYYIADIIGMRVISDEGEEIGIVRDVLETGANDVYVVKRRGGGRDLLIPVTEECILDTDIDAGVLTVHILEGLLDL